MPMIDIWPELASERGSKALEEHQAKLARASAAPQA